MTKRNFVVTVKEREAGQPCFLVFETDEQIGIGDKSVILDLRPDLDFEDVKDLARLLNQQVLKVHVG